LEDEFVYLEVDEFIYEEFIDSLSSDSDEDNDEEHPETNGEEIGACSQLKGFDFVYDSH
jgi:hypothetical protein